MDEVWNERREMVDGMFTTPCTSIDIARHVTA
jgi:hypothetical protein